MATISVSQRESPDNPVAPGEGGADPIIDFDHLGRYTLNDRELEKEILGLFIDTLTQTCRDLESAATRDQWAAAAHTLKGSARAVGAWALGDLMERLERAPEFPTDERARSVAIKNVETIGAKTKAFITALE